MATVKGALDTPALVARLEYQIMESLSTAVDHTIQVGVENAKRLAPVRKVSEITRRRGPLHQLSRAEIAKLPSSIRNNLKPGQKLFQHTRRSEQSLSAPEVVERSDVEYMRRGPDEGLYRLKNPGDESFLTGRGRRELAERSRTTQATTADVPKLIGTGVDIKTGQIRPQIVMETVVLKRPTSAIFSKGGTSTLGGRLRGEITGVFDPIQRGKVTGWVISPTEYARYVEFPTSRTAAQPYLRPTLKMLKRPFLAAVYRELKRRGFHPRPA